MALFYLHAVRGDGRAEDLEGYDALDLGQMIEEAVLAARELMASEISKGRWPDRNSHFEITDEGGRILRIFMFSEALEGER